jgi:CheY-like chemotaxis protein
MTDDKSELQILLVEDDEVAVMAVERALRQHDLDHRLRVARDGIEGLEVLRGTGGHDRLERPYVILLDLNMPRMSGHEFLEELRSDPELRSSVVFVLTTSDEPEDKMGAYDKFVAGYILKSKSGRDYNALIDMLEPYWDIVELPD